MDLPGGGALIDTAGIRSFGIAGVAAEDLAEGVPRDRGGRRGLRMGGLPAPRGRGRLRRRGRARRQPRAARLLPQAARRARGARGRARLVAPERGQQERARGRRRRRRGCRPRRSRSARPRATRRRPTRRCRAAGPDEKLIISMLASRPRSSSGIVSFQIRRRKMPLSASAPPATARLSSASQSAPRSRRRRRRAPTLPPPARRRGRAGARATPSRSSRVASSAPAAGAL